MVLGDCEVANIQRSSAAGTASSGDREYVAVLFGPRRCGPETIRHWLWIPVLGSTKNDGKIWSDESFLTSTDSPVSHLLRIAIVLRRIESGSGVAIATAKHATAGKSASTTPVGPRHRVGAADLLKPGMRTGRARWTASARQPARPTTHSGMKTAK
jgi:hypothetical protein